MAYIPSDKWAERAKREGYPARSAYKLLDIDRRFKILKRGDLVLDLGSAPGSWIQVARKKIGPEGFIVGMDAETVVAKILKTPKFVFIKKDIYDADLLEVIRNAVKNKQFNVILSDLAPSTTGQKDIDEWRSHELSLRILDVVKSELRTNGNAVIKIFEGPDTPELLKIARSLFLGFHLVKPEASAKNSKEAYIVGKNKNPQMQG